MKKRVCIFICFCLFVGDRGVKTKENVNYIKRLVSFYFKLVSFKIIKVIVTLVVGKKALMENIVNSI